MTPTPSATGVILPAGAYAVYGTADIAGVESPAVEAGNTVNIYGADGCIVIEGDTDDVSAYTLSGVQVPLSGLDPGIYIVRAGDTVKKVFVR